MEELFTTSITHIHKPKERGEIIKLCWRFFARSFFASSYYLCAWRRNSYETWRSIHTSIEEAQWVPKYFPRIRSKKKRKEWVLHLKSQTRLLPTASCSFLPSKVAENYETTIEANDKNIQI
jgi:hypothetical protein